MKKISTILVSTSLFSYGQSKDSIIIENKTIKEGDTLRLGVGSAQSGNFRYINSIDINTKLSGAFGAPVFISKKYKESENALHKSYAGTKIIVTDIKNKRDLKARNESGKKIKVYVGGAVKSNEIIL